METKTRMRERYARNKATGICVCCTTRPALPSRTDCASCKQAKIDYNKRVYARLRIEAVAHYGAICVCCKEAEPRFLALDHIENDGHIERRSHGYGVTYLRWLKKNDWPTGIQLLCHNCNQGRQLNGGLCPHEATPRCECGSLVVPGYDECEECNPGLKSKLNYGYDRTIHGTTVLNIEIDKKTNEVVSVWFRCSQIPFDVDYVDKGRADDMRRAFKNYDAKLIAVEIDHDGT